VPEVALQGTDDLAIEPSASPSLAQLELVEAVELAGVDATADLRFLGSNRN